MNERIKKLAEQCYRTGPLTRDGWPEYTTFDEAKFAELLIQECVGVLVDVLPAIVPEAQDGVHPVWHIKEHFGVA